jgi:hypothetical protein
MAAAHGIRDRACSMRRAWLTGSGRRSRALAVALALGAGFLAGGCTGRTAGAYGRLACAHVSRSLALFAQAQTAPTPAERQRLSTAALAQLRKALPLAALANSTNGEWQPLMATLSESATVPEANLVHALRAQCAADLSGANLAPPTTVASPTTPLPSTPAGTPGGAQRSGAGPR